MRVARSLAMIVFLVTSSSAFAFECGDHDASGSIDATDALRVLRRSVGLPSALDCPGESCTTTSSSTIPTGVSDPCLTNADCEYKSPDLPFCLASECAECVLEQHCDNGEVCGAGTCIPAP
jgi:hypothetical protein